MRLDAAPALALAWFLLVASGFLLLAQRDFEDVCRCFFCVIAMPHDIFRMTYLPGGLDFCAFG
jgi:hypothetical protein